MKHNVAQKEKVEDQTNAIECINLSYNGNVKVENENPEISNDFQVLR